MKRHVGPLPLDVPQRLIQPAQSAVEYWTVPPVGTDVSGLPQILDVRGVASYREGRQEFICRGYNRRPACGECGRPYAVKTGLAGFHFDDNVVASFRTSQD